MKELIQEVLEVWWTYLAHNDQMRYVLANLLEPSASPRWLRRKQAHQLACLAGYYNKARQQEESKEDLAYLRKDLRAIADECRWDEDEEDHFEEGIDVVEVRIWIDCLDKGAEGGGKDYHAHQGVDNVEDVSEVGAGRMVDHSLRQVNSARIQHHAHSKPNVVNLAFVEDHNDKEWHNRDDFDPAAEVAEYHARVLRAQKSEWKVDQEVTVHYVLVVRKPSVLLKSDKIH